MIRHLLLALVAFILGLSVSLYGAAWLVRLAVDHRGAWWSTATALVGYLGFGLGGLFATTIATALLMERATRGGDE